MIKTKKVCDISLKNNKKDNYYGENQEILRAIKRT